MNEDELIESIERLEKKKASFTRNRNISAIATVFLGYNFYNALQQDTPPLWFIIVMSAIVLACAGIGLYGHKTIKAIDTELVKFTTELEAINRSKEDSE